MIRAALRRAPVLICLYLAVSGPGRAQPIDQWHYIDVDSVLHTNLVEGLHGAGVIQADQTFAMLYLGLPGENGVVSVVLPTFGAFDEITSVLVKSSGQRFERKISGEDLDISQVNASDYAYSFPITVTDVDLFKSASRWEVSAGSGRWTMTLRGSRRAIEVAEREQARQIRDLAEAEAAVTEPSQ